MRLLPAVTGLPVPQHPPDRVRLVGPGIHEALEALFRQWTRARGWMRARRAPRKKA